MTLLFFVLSSLDLLDAMEEVDEALKHRIIEWIYRLQITTKDSMDGRHIFSRTAYLILI